MLLQVDNVEMCSLQSKLDEVLAKHCSLSSDLESKMAELEAALKDNGFMRQELFVVKSKSERDHKESAHLRQGLAYANTALTESAEVSSLALLLTHSRHSGLFLAVVLATPARAVPVEQINITAILTSRLLLLICRLTAN